MSRFLDRSYKDAIKAMQSLDAEGFQAMMAGGCVRDRVLGVIPKDYDIATDALPAQVTAHFVAQGFKVVPTGIEHGTVTVVFPGGPIEFTTLRRDVATDGRHAVVQFGHSFEDDAARRDFTINAMFEDKGGKLFDFHSGQRHIKEKLLVFVGDPNLRIKEDYLRIMRFFRFQARLGFTTHAETLAAIAAQRDGMKQVSQERITSEFWQLLGADNPLHALRDMEKTGILQLVLPEREQFASQLPDESVLKTVALIKEVWLQGLPRFYSYNVRVRADETVIEGRSWLWPSVCACRGKKRSASFLRLIWRQD
jgi:tRNA nucleotidyltransferase/poly(A) polymerase